jgi:transposase
MNNSKKFDWKCVQKYYDDNHTTREVSEKFGMARRSITKAKQRGDFIPHNRSDAMKLSYKMGRSKRNISILHRNKISNSINEKVKKGTWHVSLAKNIWKTYNGVKFHGSWEVEYAKWLDSKKIVWRRPTESFQYIFEDKKHRYTPDFYLINDQTYVEIKGYETEKDVAKWNQFPLKHLVLKENDLLKLGIQIKV